MKPLTFKNEYNIKKILWKSREVQSYCPLGTDYCTYRFEVEMVAGGVLFDYDVLHEWIDKNINGKVNTREMACHKLYCLLVKELKPVSLTVRAFNTADNSYIEI